MRVLFVNACLRGEKSRTLGLCRHYLDVLRAAQPDAEIEELDLETLPIEVQSGALIEKRDGLLRAKAYDDPMFDLARQLLAADHVVIGAPYWDLSFPARLKIWLERCSVDTLTFQYDEYGVPHGRCKAQALTYITTAGGYIGQWNYGFDYVKGLCGVLFGIRDFHFVSAEGLDIIGVDVEGKLAQAREAIDKLAAELFGQRA